jgi:2-methylcitrate dehydratase
VTPLQFTDKKIMSAGIRSQLNKVEVKADPEIEALFPKLQRVHVTIVTTDGRELAKQIDFPKGDPRNPLTDTEVEEKFDALAAPVLGKAKLPRVKAAVWSLDKLKRVSDLMKLLKVGK